MAEVTSFCHIRRSFRLIRGTDYLDGEHQGLVTVPSKFSKTEHMKMLIDAYSRAVIKPWRHWDWLRAT